MRCKHLTAGLGIGLSALAVAGCVNEDRSNPSSEAGPPTIAQPVAGGAPIAPMEDRIDLALPSFSNPTEIDNPLNPIAEIPSALVLGEVDGEPLRIEITLLEETRMIEWEGQVVENLVSQFVAYRGGRMQEVAIDYYAQADDGAVWYFGEDVFNYSDDGHVADMEGAWLAGRDGPAGMITPANPEVGDVYRSENIPGLVFEESTVLSVDETVDGPTGPVEDAYLIDEHHYPGGAEEKSFAPGYGEFFTGVGGDFELMALAVPIDALPGPPPADLLGISSAAAEIFEADRAAEWKAIAKAVDEMRADWDRMRDAEVPRLLARQMSDALGELGRAARARDLVQTRLAAIGVAVADLDLQLRHRPVLAIDFDRFDLQAAELAIDAAADDLDAVRSDLANLQWIRARIVAGLDPSDRRAIDTELVELVGAVGDENLAAVRNATARLRVVLTRAEP